MDNQPKSKSELKPLLRLAAPISLTLAGGLLMQVVDTMFVGRLGAEAIGGVSVGNAMFATLMIVGLGLLTGLDFLASHAFGAGRLKLCHEYLVSALYLATIASVLLGASMDLGSLTFRWFGLDPEVARLGAAYLRTVSWSLLPFLLFTAIRQYLQAMGVAAPALVILIVANLVNVVGNWIFVFGHLGMPALGVVGSGISTFFSRVFMLVAIALYAVLRDRRLALGLKGTSWRFERAPFVEMVRLGGPSALQMFFEVGVFATATMLAGRLGAVPLAAHQIVLQIASLTFMVPLGIASATSVRVGQAIGAGQRERASRIGWSAIAMGVAFAVLMGTAMLVFASPLMRAFTIDDAVVALGASLLLVVALFQVSDATQVIGAGALRGTGDTKISMYANLVGHWFLGLPAGSLLCFWWGWGARGIWIGLSIGLTSVALALLLAWWQKSKT